MGKNTQPKATDAELEILRVLWSRGPSTVRKVMDELARSKPVGYTTVLKFLQIMTEKGLVTRDKSKRTHVYSAKATQAKTQKQMLGRLVDKVFGGSTADLVAQALTSSKTTAAERKQIRELLDELEGESK